MSTTLVKIDGPSDIETGLAVKESIVTQSGFNYVSGARLFNNLRIIEGVAKGTANIFLNSVKVFDENGTLLIDEPVEKYTSYTRETTRRIVLEGLIKMLHEAVEKKGKEFDELEAREILDSKLKTAYFKESYSATIRFAREIGINIY
jgi:hypothetical protein